MFRFTLTMCVLILLWQDGYATGKRDSIMEVEKGFQKGLQGATTGK